MRSIENFDGKKRVKEFYAMSAEDAYAILESIAKISGTMDRLKRLKPEGHEIEDEKIANEVEVEAKHGPFRFSICGIQPNEMIQFIENPAIQAKVIDDRRIEYNGQTTSLSALARQLKGFKHPVQGTLWFSYKGTKLTDLRSQFEK